MATAPLDLKLTVKGAGELDKLVKRMDVLEKEVNQLNRSLPKVSNNIRKVGASSSVAAQQTSTFTKAVGALGAAFATVQLGAGFGEAIKDARALELSARRLKLLTAEYSQFNGVQKEAERLAAKFEVSVADSSKALFSLGSRLGAQGTTLEEIVSVYEGLNSALIVTGRSSQEAAAASYQLAQALGSGKLTGDELKTISETLPELLNEIATQAGKSATEIRQMAKDGQLTTDIIIKATKALGEKYAPAVKDSITINQKFNNSIQGVSEKIGKSLLPVIDPAQEALTKLLNTVIALPDPLVAVGTAAVAAAVGIGALQASLSLLGLPGIIALLGKLSVALAGVAGVTTTAVTGFTAAGAAIKATTVVVTAQTVALGALKIAMLAVPWVAAAAGVVAIGTAAVQATNKINKMRDAMYGVSDSMQGLRNRIVDMENEIKRLEKKMGTGGNAARGYARKVRELKLALEDAKGLYEIELRVRAFLDKSGVDVSSLDKGFYGPGGAAPVVEVPETPTGGGGGGGGGGGAAPRESEVPALTRAYDLSKKLLEIDRQILEAQFTENKLAVEALKIKRIDAELAGKVADINAEKIPDNEKEIKQNQALLEAERQLVTLNYENLEIDKQRQATIEAAFLPLQQETELLEAKLLGLGKEVALRQQAANIAAATPGIDQAQVEAILRKNEALREQLKAQEELEAQAKQLATAISSEIGGAFKSIIQGTKTTQEAFADMFQGIADQFLDMALKILQDAITQQLMSLFTSLLGGNSSGIPGLSGNPAGRAGAAAGGFGGFFAKGGTLGAGEWGIAGEAGPEVVRGPASISPMGAGGNTVVNITVNGNGGGTSSSSGSNATEAARLGKLIERSTLAIINREKRAGGILSSTM